MAAEFSNPEIPSTVPEATEKPRRTWAPLTKIQRRVLGVLIEKSKTTPDVYPMTINGIKTGSNQKSNRSPLMELTEEQVENTLEELRRLGCVIEVHSGGRVPKYKHQAYEWLGVQKLELGVLAELLLRGEQTVGELRARSARMEKGLENLDDLFPVLNDLLDKGLLMELTPKGRGQVVTHNLYPDSERERLQTEFPRQSEFDGNNDSSEPAGSTQVGSPATSHSLNSPQAPAVALSNRGSDSIAGRGLIEARLDRLENEVAELRGLVEELKALIES